MSDVSSVRSDQSQTPGDSTRRALMSAKLGARVDLKKKINHELMKMGLVVVALLGLGIYAFDFVLHGVMAKPDLNGIIIVTFILTLYIAFQKVWILKDDKLAIESLRADFGDKRPGPDVVDMPAKIFKKPKLLGFGYQLVTEELLSKNKGQLSTETVHLLVKDVDQRISDAKATMGYFGGLLVFLGLLGAFIGLMKTVASVGDLIGGMNMSGGGDSSQFGAMIEGMKKPLNGMSVGFSSSLFGLLFSMAVGVIDRFMAAAMKAVRNEFEACLMDLAQLEMVTHAPEAGHKAPTHQHSAAASGVMGEAGLSQAQAAQLVASLHRSEHQYAKTNELLAQLNASLMALATSTRQNADGEGRREVAASIKDMAASQRELALHFSAMRSDMDAHQTRMVESLQSFTRAQEETRDAITDIGLRSSGFGMVAGNGSSPKTIKVQVNGAPGTAGQAQAAVAAAQAQAVGVGGAGGYGGFGPMAPMGGYAPAPAAPVQDSDAGLHGARALMAKLANALGQKREGGKAVNDERARKLEQAVIATQQMSRQVLRRFDETRKDEARVAVATSKANRQLIASLDMLVGRLDGLMEDGEIVPKGRMAELFDAVDAVRAQLDVGIDRLESQVNASKVEAERAQTAAASAAQEAAKVGRMIQDRTAKAAGAR